MARVLGIGGVFFKSRDPEKLQSWYCEHLGIESDTEGYVLFGWNDKQDPQQEHYTVWAPFPQDTTYFDPTAAPYMINYIVDDLDGMLQQLRAAGIQVDDKIEEMEYGRFGWAIDPEGVRFELWQPSIK
jgi:predicted enzyme related to lactoylglutathione lyase